MRKGFFVLSVLALFLMTACSNPADNVYNKGINIIPTPESIELLSDDGFVLSPNTTITVTNEGSYKVASYFVKK